MTDPTHQPDTPGEPVTQPVPGPEIEPPATPQEAPPIDPGVSPPTDPRPYG